MKCDVSTMCMGMAASMGAFLLAGGAKGKRFALPNADIMNSSALRGSPGQASDIKIVADKILQTRQKLNQLLSENTGQPLDVIAADTERDRWLSAQEAKDYGLIDEIVLPRLALQWGCYKRFFCDSPTCVIPEDKNFLRSFLND